MARSLGSAVCQAAPMSPACCSVPVLQGGANAGHTIYDDKGTRFALHLVPSGILGPNTICVSSFA